MGAYPQVQAFIKSDRVDKFPGLEIRYKRGQDPVVKLMDAAGEVQETLAVDKWTTDALEEFLLEYLETRSSSSSVDQEEDDDDSNSAFDNEL
jgi:hypothetical protein